MGERFRLTTVAILASFLLSSCSPLAFAQPPWTKYVYSQNWGGLNDNLSTTEIQDGEATDIQNVVYDSGGALKKRLGYFTVPRLFPATSRIATATSINGLTYFNKSNGYKFIFALANMNGIPAVFEKPYNTTSGDLDEGAWKPIHNTGIGFRPYGTTYTANHHPDFAIASDGIVFTIGVNTKKPFYWSSSGAVVKLLTSDADCASGSIVEYHKNILFTAGDPTYKSRVHFSDLNDITDFVATDWFDVSTDDGSQITGLISAFDSLYIFKDKSIWRLSGYDRDSFRLEKMANIGTLSNNSIALVNNVIYFTTAQNDICAYNGGYETAFVSQKIRNTTSNLAMDRADHTQGIAFSSYRNSDTDYYTSVSDFGQTQNNKVLIFDTFHKAWTKFKGINANSWTVAPNNDGRDVLYFGDYKGYVHKYPSTAYYDSNVATSAIEAYYQTKWFTYPELCLGDKYWRLLKTYCLNADSTTLYADCKSDYEASGKVISIDLNVPGALWDVAEWDTDSWAGDSIIVGRNEIDKGTNMFQIRYYNNDVNKGFTILNYAIFVEPTDRI